MTPVPLNRAALATLPASVGRPGFDVAAVRPGIVHLGMGGFHRAHMARYTHDLMGARPDALGWGIVGAGLLPGDRRLADSLLPQDHLYTLVERSGTEEAVTVIGSLADVVFAGDDSAALLHVIDQPGIRIVSLTVTENGYCLNRATKRLDLDNELIRADLAQPERPRSAIGVIVEACRRRCDAGASAFTALSCDNIQHNGAVLQDAVLTLARLRDPALAEWIAAQVSFPSTMVDRITPVTAPAEIAALAERHGLADRWPVFCETFTQWVIEDRFVAGRPAWETVGAQFVDDVAPYEFMKLRLLNASHLAVAGLGRLAGSVTIDEAMGDPLMTRYMTALMDRETGPTLPDVPGIDLARLQGDADRAVRQHGHQGHGGAGQHGRAAEHPGGPDPRPAASGDALDLLALGLAAWLRRVRGEDEAGQPIDVRHPMAAELRQMAVQGGSDPAPLLGITALFGDLGTDPRLLAPVGRWLASLYRDGSRATLARAAAELSF